MAFKTDAEFKEFETLWNRQLNVNEDLRIVRRLLDETQALAAQVEKALLEEYGIQPDRQYRYDAAEESIFEMPSDRARQEEKPRLHRRLSKEAERARFLALLQARESVRIQMQGLNLVLQRKRQELETVGKALLNGYAMSRDRAYVVESETRTVWEIIPVVKGSTGRSR